MNSSILFEEVMTRYENRECESKVERIREYRKFIFICSSFLIFDFSHLSLSASP